MNLIYERIKSVHPIFCDHCLSLIVFCHGNSDGHVKEVLPARIRQVNGLPSGNSPQGLGGLPYTFITKEKLIDKYPCDIE